jgi:hypothetical protein
MAHFESPVAHTPNPSPKYPALARCVQHIVECIKLQAIKGRSVSPSGHTDPIPPAGQRASSARTPPPGNGAALRVVISV